MSWFSYEDLQVFFELLFDCGVDRGGVMSLLWLFFFCWEESLSSLGVYFFVLAKNLDMLFVLRGELFYFVEEEGKICFFLVVLFSEVWKIGCVCWVC